MEARFVLDTNFFIQAHRMYYPLDIAPNFWLKIKNLAERGIIVSIDKVKDEIFLSKDALCEWCELSLPKEFFQNTDVLIKEYYLVTNWAHGKSDHYNAAALNEFLDVLEADAWLVAYAIANGCKIVTHETSDPKRKNKVKIPDVCSAFTIHCLNTIDMFRELGEQF